MATFLEELRNGNIRGAYDIAEDKVSSAFDNMSKALGRFADSFTKSISRFLDDPSKGLSRIGNYFSGKASDVEKQAQNFSDMGDRVLDNVISSATRESPSQGPSNKQISQSELKEITRLLERAEKQLGTAQTRVNSHTQVEEMRIAWTKANQAVVQADKLCKKLKKESPGSNELKQATNLLNQATELRETIEIKGTAIKEAAKQPAEKKSNQGPSGGSSKLRSDGRNHPRVGSAKNAKNPRYRG